MNRRMWLKGGVKQWLRELDEKVNAAEKVAVESAGGYGGKPKPYMPLFDGAREVVGCFRARKLTNEGGE